jgi:hypothetical protein
MGQAIYMEGMGVRDSDGETRRKGRVEGLDVDGRFVSRHTLQRKSARSRTGFSCSPNRNKWQVISNKSTF